MLDLTEVKFYEKCLITFNGFNTKKKIASTIVSAH